MGAGRAPGLPRHQPRLLRRRAAPAGRPAAPDPRAVLRRGDRRPAGRRLPRPAAGLDPRRPPGAARRGQRGPDDPRAPVPHAARRAEPALRPLPRGRSRIPARRCRSTASGSSPASSRSPRAAASARRGGSRGRMRPSPATAASSGCAPQTLQDLRAPAIPPRRGLPRRLHARSGPVLARVHEAHPGLAVRSRGCVRVARRRRLARLRGPGDGDRVCVRDEPDGRVRWRSPRRRAPPGHAA